MAPDAPNLIVLAGPNGAGKSTTAPALLRDLLGVSEFVNADTIAQGLSGFAPESSAIAAGRAMLARLDQLASARADFAFETTLASRTFAPWIAKLRTSGYRIHLVFLWLPSADLAVARVRDRVRAGGHDVPELTVRRRYDRGLRNFSGLYKALADRWIVYDNSQPAGARLIARRELNSKEEILDATTWKRTQAQLAVE